MGFNVEFLEETVNEKMLTLFYNDPKKYAFALQVHLATFCQANLAKAHHKSNQNGTICIVDRCLWGNAVFAAMHASSENMSMTEWEAYMSILSKGKYYTCGHVVYLDCDPEKCLERVLKRARKSEKPIDISYLKALERYYTTEMLLHVKYETANVVILPWNDYGDVKYVLDQIVQHRPYSISENEDMLQIFNASREQRSDFIQKLLQQRIQK